MVTAIEGITLSQGIDPTEAVMIGGGGGAGLYSVGIARRLGVARVVLPDVAPALSATGALVSDLQTMFASTHVMSTAAFDPIRAGALIADLRSRGEEFLDSAGEGAQTTELSLTVEARYPHHVWEIEVPLRSGELQTSAQVEAFHEDFHAAHDELFAVRDAAAAVEIVTWRAHALCRLRSRPLGRVRAGKTPPGLASSRQAYLPGLGLVETPVRTPESLGVGERLVGPLIVESGATTVVLDEGSAVELAESGSLRIDPLVDRFRPSPDIAESHG
jgi:N-methylhydantoinase A